jgi:uncharacterized protein
VQASRYNLEIDIESGVILVNLLSRAVLELDRDSFGVFKELVHGRTHEIEDPDLADFTQVLKAGLFLIDEDFDEMANLRERVLRERYSQDELAVVIAPTMGCNFSCHYCFESRPDELMTTEAEAGILNYVSQHLDGRKSLSVQWFGGEPLRALGQLDRISRGLISLADERDIAYSAAIVTNGFLLTKEVASLLHTLKIHTAQITLDGDKYLHDRTRDAGADGSSFEAILTNIVHAGSLIDIRLRIHVAPFNLAAVKRLLADLADRGIGNFVKAVYFAPLFNYKPSDRSNQFSPDTKRFYDAESFARVEVELFEELARLHLPMPDILDAPFSVCTAVRDNAIVVGPSGRFYKCYFELDKPARSVGDLRGGVLMSNHLEQWLNHEIARDDECRSCKFLPVCFGGCSHKWQEHAPKNVICTRLRYNAPELLRLAYSVLHSVG